MQPTIIFIAAQRCVFVIKNERITGFVCVIHNCMSHVMHSRTFKKLCSSEDTSVCKTDDKSESATPSVNRVSMMLWAVRKNSYQVTVPFSVSAHSDHRGCECQSAQTHSLAYTTSAHTHTHTLFITLTFSVSDTKHTQGMTHSLAALD